MLSCITSNSIILLFDGVVSVRQVKKMDVFPVTQLFHVEYLGVVGRKMFTSQKRDIKASNFSKIKTNVCDLTLYKPK